MHEEKQVIFEQKPTCFAEKAMFFSEKELQNLGTTCAITETTEILVYQVADPFSPPDVPAKLLFAADWPIITYGTR